MQNKTKTKKKEDGKKRKENQIKAKLRKAFVTRHWHGIQRLTIMT